MRSHIFTKTFTASCLGSKLTGPHKLNSPLIKSSKSAQKYTRQTGRLSEKAV